MSEKKRVSWPLEGQPKQIELCQKLNYINICTTKNGKSWYCICIEKHCHFQSHFSMPLVSEIFICVFDVLVKVMRQLTHYWCIGEIECIRPTSLEYNSKSLPFLEPNTNTKASPSFFFLKGSDTVWVSMLSIGKINHMSANTLPKRW